MSRYLFAVLLGACVSAQQPLWTLPSGLFNGCYYSMEPFGDFDQDGVRDLLVQGCLSSPGAGIHAAVLSGATGLTLWQEALSTRRCAHAGDVDGDGRPDIALAGITDLPVMPLLDDIRIFSPARNQLLWRVMMPFYGSGQVLLGDIDVNGDGHQDFVASVLLQNVSEIRVYNHLGVLLYSRDLVPLGLGPTSAANMGDMDGDGGDDFVLGCRNVSGRGEMNLVSGRTGTILRTSPGLVPASQTSGGSQTSAHATNVGDIDYDGVPDFIGASHWTGSAAWIVAYSGATGSVLRSFEAAGETMIATEDVDLDGIRDVIASAGYQVQPQLPSTFGRTRAFSLRDGTVLWSIDNTNSQISGDFWARGAAGLGPVGSDPYPAIAFFDLMAPVPSGTGNGQIRAYRATPRGQGPVTGVACSSSGPAPKIGVRSTATGVRITVSRAKPGALALLSVALAGQATFAGQALPLSLAPYGWNGCTMLVGPDAAQMTGVGGSGVALGYAAVDWGVQLASTLGVGVAAQWFVFDPASLTYAATPRHILRVQ